MAGRKEVYIQLTGDYSGRINLDDTQAVPVEKAVTDIRNPETKTGSKSYPFKVKGTHNNRLVIDALPRKKQITCELIEDGVAVIENAFIQVESRRENQSNSNAVQEIEYTVNLRDIVSALFAEVGDSELTDLDFSELNHEYSSTNVVASFDHTVSDGYKYLMGLSSGNVYNLTEFRPALYVEPILNKIVAKHGFSIDWATRHSDKTRLDKWVIPYNGDVPKQNADTLSGYKVEAEKNSLQTFTSAGASGLVANIAPTQLTIPIEVSDPSGAYNPTTSVYTSPFYYIGGGHIAFTVVVEWELVLNNTTGGNAYLVDVSASPFTRKATLRPATSIGKLGGVSGQGTAFLYSGSGSGNVELTEGLSIAPGETAIASGITTGDFAPSLANASDEYRIGAYVGAENLYNMRWKTANTVGASNAQVNTVLKITSVKLSISPSMSEFGYGQTITMNDFVPRKTKQADILKAIFTHQNAIVRPDKTQPRKLIVMNRDDFYDSGRVVGVSEFVVDKRRDKERKAISLNGAKRGVWKYKQDTDEPNMQFEALTNEIYGQVEYVYQTELENGTDAKEIAFSPTPCVSNDHGAVVPMINGVAPKTNIRLLYDGGNHACGAYTIVDYVDSATGQNVGQTLSIYPSFNHLDKPFNPSFDLLFSPSDAMYYNPITQTANNAFNSHWRRTAKQIDEGDMMTIWLVVKPDFIRSLVLNEKFYIDSTYWLINRVQYNASDNGVYKFELIEAEDELALPPFRSKKPVYSGMGDVFQSPGKDVTDRGQIFNNIIASFSNPLIHGKNNSVASSVKSAVILGDGNNVSATKSIVIGDGVEASEEGVYTPFVIFPDGSKMGSTSDLVSTNFFTGNQLQIGDRLHNGAGYSVEIENAKGFKVKGETTQGTTDVILTVESQRSTSGYKIAELISATGTAVRVWADRTARFFKQVGIGDDPQSNIQLQVYGNGMDKGINVEATNSASKGIVSTSSGANGTGGQFTCQAGGGIGASGLGDAIGIEGKTTTGSGTAGVFNGKLLVQDYNGTAGRRSCATLDVQSTTGFLVPPSMTTTQRDAVASPKNGAMLFNTTTDQMEYYKESTASWVAF